MDTLNSSAENGKRTKKKNASKMKKKNNKTRFGNTSQEIRVIETDVSVHFKVFFFLK